MEEFELNFNTLNRAEWKKAHILQRLKNNDSHREKISNYIFESTIKDCKKDLHELKQYSNDFIDIECQTLKGVKFLSKDDIINKVSKLLKVPIEIIKNDSEYKNSIQNAYEINLKKVLKKQIAYNFGLQIEVYLRKKYYGEQINTHWYQKGPFKYDKINTMNDFPSLHYINSKQINPHWNYKWIPDKNKLIKFVDKEWPNNPNSQYTIVYGKNGPECDYVTKKLFEMGDFKIICNLDGEIKNDVEFICRYEKIHSNKSIRYWGIAS